MPIRRVDTLDAPSGEKVTVGSGNNTFTLPTTRGTDNYVLTRDNSIGTGGTTWKETIVAPTITSITYPTQNGVQATALAATGAQDTTAETLLINGQNLGDVSNPPTVQIQVSGSYVTFAGTVSCNATGTVATCTNVTKRASADNYNLRLTHATNSQTALTTVNFSADPSFSTASGSLGTVYTGLSVSKTITAGSSVSWYEGTPTMPTWMTHFADGDTGTSKTLTDSGSGPTNSGTSEVQNFNIIIRDAENQSHNRDFSLTVVDAPTGGQFVITGSVSGTNKRIHIFKNASTSFSTYSNITNAEYIIVAGGGGGGGDNGGGGGAGALRSGTVSFEAGAVYTVQVGDGGAYQTKGSDSQLSRASGGTGSFTSITAEGGGEGGTNNLEAGQNGGSGGGGVGVNNANYTPKGNANNSSYGNDGADGYQNSGIVRGGGGGGAGAAGGSSSDPYQSKGGDGSSAHSAILTVINADSNVTDTIGESDSGTWYLAGGGGGGSNQSQTNIGGKGGGGRGESNAASLVDALDYTGGGGAGRGQASSGGAGGSGIVIISYAI